VQSDQITKIPDRDQLAARVAELRQELRNCEPADLASRTGANLTSSAGGETALGLLYWGQEVILTYPELVGYDANKQPLSSIDQAMLAYYFTISDGTALSGNWISFSELPNGHFYSQAFQGYSGNELGKVFGNNVAAFEKAAKVLNGQTPWLSASYGDKSFVFQVLPYVSLQAVAWLGDEDFPPSYRILFDAAISHHLSTDACAILGSMLTRRLIKAQESQIESLRGAS
jgi:hypothetical protein